MNMHIWGIQCSVIYNIEKLKLNEVVQKRSEEIRAHIVKCWGHSQTVGGMS